MNNPFHLEKKRAVLAKKLKFKELKSTYNEKNPQIEDKNSSRLWDKLNTSIKDYSSHTNPMAVDRNNIIARKIKGVHINVLNIGFGSTNLEHQYFKKNKKIVSWNGIDISRRSVSIARNLFPHAIFSLGDIRSIKSDDNYYDFVIASEVLEHIQPKYTFVALNEVFRVLKPGGHFILSVPLNENLEEMIQNGINPNAHVRIYTPELIKAELSISGFAFLESKSLYAFNSFYRMKTFLIKYFLRDFRKPNDIVIIAKKPGQKR